MSTCTYFNDFLNAEVFGESQVETDSFRLALTHHVDVALVRHVLHVRQLTIDVQRTSGFLTTQGADLRVQFLSNAGMPESYLWRNCEADCMAVLYVQRQKHVGLVHNSDSVAASASV